MDRKLGEGRFEILVLCGSHTRLAIVELRLSIEAAKVAAPGVSCLQNYDSTHSSF